MPSGTRITIAEFQSEKSLFVRCEGRCTMGVCPSIRARIAAAAPSQLEHVYFELSEADAIDSTFTGYLLSIRREQSKGGTPALHIVAPSENALRTFETMQVLRLLHVVDALPTLEVDWKPLETEPVDINQTGEIVIDAHVNLIEADERNREQFGRVVEQFKKFQPPPKDPN